MAFPSVAADYGGHETTNSLNHTVTLPSSIAAGDLLLVFFASDGNPTIAFPGGWTQLFQTASGTAVKYGAWYRIADGSEGSTIKVTTTASEMCAYTSYRIIDYSGTPEAVTPATGASQYPDPPSLTPSWGAKDTLWFACQGNDADKTVSAYPSSYVSGRNDYCSASGSGVGTARRELNAASENPGTFTLSAAEDWVASTVAVRPSEGVAKLSEQSYAVGWTSQSSVQVTAPKLSEKNYPLGWTPAKELGAALSSEKNYTPGWASASSVQIEDAGIPKQSVVNWPLGWTSYAYKGIIGWKGLTDTLIAAQKKLHRTPYVEAKVYDFEQGIKRLTWTSLYTGSEPDNHHGIAFDGQGSMHRIRAQGSNLYYQKITTPGPSSDYSQWTQLATDCYGPCAIAAYGAKVYIFYRTTGNVLWKYYSHDYGQSWNNAQLVSYTNVLSMAACWWGTGNIVVCFALKSNELNGIVLDTSTQSTSQHIKQFYGAAVHIFLDTYGIGATFNPFWPAIEIVLAGKESDTPYNHYDLFRTWFSNTYNFLALESFLTAPDGEGVTYEYPDCHLPANAELYEPNRIVAVEKFTGTTAYARPLTCHTVKGTYWSDTTFTEPKPFLDVAPAYGLRLQSTSDYWWLSKPDGVWRAPRPAAAPLTLTTDALSGRILSLTQRCHPERSEGSLIIELDNSQGQYNVGAGLVPALINKRSEIVLKLGYKTTAGDETSEAGTYWIDGWQYSVTQQTQSTLTLFCLDGSGLIDRWTARYQMRWNKDDIGPKSVWQILYQLLARVGIKLTNTPPKPQSSAINSFYPDFTVNPGTQGDSAIRRLLSFVPDQLVFRGQEAFTKNPLANEASCYSYGTDHAILSGKYTNAVTVSRARAIGRDVSDNRILEEAQDWDLLQLAIDTLEQMYDPNLQTATRAQERADALLREASLRAKRGNLVVPTNVGQELYDVITVTDARCGISEENYRVQAIRTDYDRRQGIYTQRLALCTP